MANSIFNIESIVLNSFVTGGSTGYGVTMITREDTNNITDVVHCPGDTGISRQCATNTTKGGGGGGGLDPGTIGFASDFIGAAGDAYQKANGVNWVPWDLICYAGEHSHAPKGVVNCPPDEDPGGSHPCVDASHYWWVCKTQNLADALCFNATNNSTTCYGGGTGVGGGVVTNPII